ncbi:MAG: TRAP transporter permease [Spirochaetes bacterium]|nr:TRAP transporter permease [Spirochaetota bacterium]
MSDPKNTAVSPAPEPVEEKINADEILKKFDRESDKRTLTGFIGKVVTAIAIVFTCFQVYTAVFGMLDATIQRSVHLSFGLCLIYLLYPMQKKWSRTSINPIDFVMAIVGAAIPMYIVVNYQALLQGPLAGSMDPFNTAVGVVGILIVLEGARRCVGMPIVIIASVFILYALFGRFMPGFLIHRGVNPADLIQHLFFTTEGVFGIPLGASATFIFVFILFGAFLEKTGLGQFFIDISNAIAGWASGGPAKVAVIASALEGTVSGSSVANVVGSGSFTIPMMKKLGYNADFAGAVEAAASTGGQIMPPIMGAAAFLMAERTGIPYSRIIAAAAIPALLYFFGVFAGVHFEAKKSGLRGMSRSELPKILPLFAKRGLLILPLVGIIWLLVTGFTPVKAAMMAIVISVFSSIVVSFLNKEKVISLKDILDAFENGGKGVLGVLAATACAGIIIGVITKTGLGLKLGSGLIALANNNLFLTLVFTMITSLILGMGVPTTANYIITSVVAAPAVITILAMRTGLAVDVESIVLPANMFVFYFGIIADITPPVALAAFAGAAIAKGNPMRTGVIATKLAVAAFLVPYIFVYNPQMLLFGVEPLGLIQMIITSCLGMIGVSAAMIGFFLKPLNPIFRIAAFMGGILLVIPGLLTDGIGALILVAIFLFQKFVDKPGNGIKAAA